MTAPKKLGRPSEGKKELYKKLAVEAALIAVLEPKIKPLAVARRLKKTHPSQLATIKEASLLAQLRKARDELLRMPEARLRDYILKRLPGDQNGKDLPDRIMNQLSGKAPSVVRKLRFENAYLRHQIFVLQIPKSNRD